MKALGQATKGRTSICIAHRYVLSFHTHSFKQKRLKPIFLREVFARSRLKKKLNQKLRFFKRAKLEFLSIS